MQSIVGQPPIVAAGMQMEWDIATAVKRRPIVVLWIILVVVMIVSHGLCKRCVVRMSCGSDVAPSQR